MADLFKGYILSNGKVPHESLKTAKLLDEPPVGHDYVGVLREGYIQLDFDDIENTEKAMKIVEEYKLRCDVLETSRGVHLYFKNDEFTKSQSVGTFNSMGLKCDIGLGTKNRVIPLRVTKPIKTTRIVDGEEITIETTQVKERVWLQTYTELESIPPYFRPFTKEPQNFHLVEARNQALFEYILKLQFHGYTREEVRKTLKVINTHMFYEPLSDRELDIISRDDAFSEELFYGAKGGFLHHRFGDYMLANSNILMIDRQPHIYTRDHLYSNLPDEFERCMVDKIQALKDSQRKEVYKYLNLKARRKGEFANPRYLGLKDSIIDIETFEEFSYSPKWIIPNKIDFNYNANAYSEVMDKTLDKVACGDPQIRMLLEEMIGYTLFRKNTMQSCFILTGEGSNGKSTLLDVVKRLLGKGNYTSLEIQDLEDQYKPAELHNKLANIGDDISNKYMNNSSIFKKVVTGESFVTARKYGQPFELESYATQIFCANELPQVNDKSDGFSRRIVIVPFNARFKKSDVDYDPFIEEKLKDEEAMEYLLKIAIEGLKRVIYNQSFTVTDEGVKEMDEYNKLNNNVLEWIGDEPPIANNSIADVYMTYQVWCAKNGNHPVKKMNLSKTIKKELGLVSKPKSIDGKTVRVYAR